MFNKLKQIKDLRQQAKGLQNALNAETITVNKHGVSLTINGNLEVTALSIADKTMAGLENTLRDCFNDATKQVQKIMAKKMQEMGGLPDLNSLLKK